MTYQSAPTLEQMILPPPGRIRSAIRRQRYQLAGALAVGVLAPILLRFGWVNVFGGAGEAGAALVVAGIIATHFLFRHFSRYPGETPFSTALPAATIGFGLVTAVIVLTHLPYSRLLLLWGYASAVGWYATVDLLRARYFPPRLLLLPQAAAPELSWSIKVEWMNIAAPVAISTAMKTQGVVADLNAELPPAWRDFLVDCGTAGVPVFDSARTQELVTGQVELTSLANIGFEALLPHRTYQKFKWAVDVLGAAVALPAALPLIAVAAVAIRLESPGPAFFVQRRMGYRGKIFRCYKIRSMTASAQTTGPSFTVADDSRITRVGRFIRKYRIDELPQIFNILKGEMSWIGPRPEAVELAQSYGRTIPYYAFRYAVKPGMTGWAAIRQGNVAEVDAATIKLRYDFFYIKNLSLALDALIAAKTVWILLTGRGSR